MLYWEEDTFSDTLLDDSKEYYANSSTIYMANTHNPLVEDHDYPTIEDPDDLEEALYVDLNGTTAN